MEEKRKCKTDDCDHEATVKFSESTMAYIHGEETHLCQCCYVNLIRERLNNVADNLKEQLKLLAENGCK